MIEDTAQAHGACVRGRRAGSIGDFGCFSFYPTKNLGGGATAARSSPPTRTLAERVRLLRSHGESPRYHHKIVGTTARLDALQAALLRVKLRHLDARNEDRRRLGAALRAGLAGTSVELPRARLRGRRPRLPPVHRALRPPRRAARAPGGARRLERRALPVPDPPDRGLRGPRPGRGQPARRRAAGRADLHAAAVPDDVRRRGRAGRGRGRELRRARSEHQMHRHAPIRPARERAAQRGRRRLRLLGPEPRPQRHRAPGVRSSPASASATRSRAAAFSAKVPGRPGRSTDLDAAARGPGRSTP